ncbi:MAG: NTP transferase domain-containing protein [Kiritimatiellae bacterium]|nr:NTP transferase domain-containing protein [Kiritimatiellia bacterium]
MKPTLVILAAGIGSRYGGLKQLDPIGPGGEVVMDYSVYDALQAGFGRIVPVIRPDLEKDFREMLGRRLENQAEVVYAFQTLDDVPAGFSVPPERKKPWGTAHAVFAARRQVQTPFAVINADDFYGRHAFMELAAYLQSAPTDSTDYCMVGFELAKTLSEYGTVSRGVCTVNPDGWLEQVTEFTRLGFDPAGRIVHTDETGETPFEGHETVSMNTWGFFPGFFQSLEKSFAQFLEENGRVERSEFYIPSVVDPLIRSGAARVRVLHTPDPWFGVTYHEDKPWVMQAVRSLIDAGIYPEHLWSESR